MMSISSEANDETLSTALDGDRQACPESSSTQAHANVKGSESMLSSSIEADAFNTRGCVEIRKVVEGQGLFSQQRN